MGAVHASEQLRAKEITCPSQVCNHKKHRHKTHQGIDVSTESKRGCKTSGIQVSGYEEDIK